MALGELTKQFAKQAISDQVTDLLDSGKPKQPESLGQIILAQVQAMQRACKEDQELAVLFNAGSETIRVVELYVPSAQLLVLTGHDPNRNLTRIISTPESIQLVCKVLTVQAGATPSRINFLLPKPKA